MQAVGNRCIEDAARSSPRDPTNAGFETPWPRLREPVPLSEHGGNPTFALTLAIREKRMFRQGRDSMGGSAQARIEDRLGLLVLCCNNLPICMRVLQVSQTSTDIDLCSLTAHTGDALR